MVSSGQTVLTGRTGERLLYTLRVKSFAQLQRLGLDYYERELGGRIMTRMTTDVDALSNFLQTGLATALISVLTLVGVLVALLLLDGQLSLVLVAMLPVLVVATSAFRRRAVPAYVEARERVSTVNAQFQENVAGVRVTQVFSREQHNTDRLPDVASDYRDSRLRAQRLHRRCTSRSCSSWPTWPARWCSPSAPPGCPAARSARRADRVLPVPGCLLRRRCSSCRRSSTATSRPRSGCPGSRTCCAPRPAPRRPPSPRPVDQLRGELRLSEVDFRYPAPPSRR